LTLDPPLLCVLVDAFRHDYMDRLETPYVTALAQGATSRPLRPILGYSDSIRAVIFTGKHPEDHGYWMEYCYRPESSPWTGLSRWAALDRLPSDFIQRVVKFGLSRTVLRRQAHRSGLTHMDLRHVPFRAIDKLDLTIHADMTAPKALGVPTIFDDCRDSGRPFSYLSSTRLSPPRLLAEIDTIPTETGLVFVYLHQIDMVAHIFGMDSRRFHSTVADVDEYVGAITARMQRRFPGAATMLFSDHGMSTLHRQVSLERLTNHPGFPSRFFVALDATMARLWYFDDDDDLRGWVRHYIASQLPGRFLTEGDRRELRLRFDEDLYGEDIFLTEPGWGIFPNFHSYVKPKAMHAYHPDNSDQWGLFVGPEAAGVDAEIMEMTDIAPLCRRYMGTSARPEPATGIG